MGMEDLFFCHPEMDRMGSTDEGSDFKILHFTLLHSEFVRVTYTTINENVLFGRADDPVCPGWIESSTPTIFIAMT